MATVTDGDIGKAVQTPDGEPIGQIAAVEGNTIYVDTDPGAVETGMAIFGLESDPEKALTIDEVDVDHVIDDAIHISTDTLREEGSGAAVAGRAFFPHHRGFVLGSMTDSNGEEETDEERKESQTQSITPVTA